MLLRLAFWFLLASVAVLTLGLWRAEGGAGPRALAPLLVLPVWASAAWLLHRRLNRSCPARDPLLLPIVLLLSGWGMVINWRLSFEYGARQTAWFLVSIALLMVIVEAPAD